MICLLKTSPVEGYCSYGCWQHTQLEVSGLASEDPLAQACYECCGPSATLRFTFHIFSDPFTLRLCHHVCHHVNHLWFSSSTSQKVLSLWQPFFVRFTMIWEVFEAASPDFGCRNAAMDLDWLWEGSTISTPRRKAQSRPPKLGRSAGLVESCTASRKPRSASRKTLAEAMAAGSQVLSWRGDTLQSIELANQASREMGHHFRDCVLAKAAHDRLRAARWAQRKSEKSWATGDHGPDRSEEVRNAVCKAFTEPGLRPEIPNLMEKTVSLQTSSRRASMARRMSLKTEQPERRKSLQANVMERRSSQGPTKMMKYNRLQRLLAAKQAEFDALAPSMQDKLRLAFNHAKDEAWKVSFV